MDRKTGRMKSGVGKEAGAKRYTRIRKYAAMERTVAKLQGRSVLEQQHNFMAADRQLESEVIELCAIEEAQLPDGVSLI